MQKHKLFTLALLCGTAFAMNATELPESVQKNNLFQEFRLGQGMIYEVYVKSGARLFLPPSGVPVMVKNAHVADFGGMTPLASVELM